MIDSFEKEFRFLSNFYPCKIVDKDGIEYQSVEAAYQAAKAQNPLEKENFAALDASKAKKLGRKIVIRPDWDNVKLKIMENFLYQKFSNELLMEKLLQTKDEELIEGNWWGDTYWGVCKGIGENNLGKLLMKIRADYGREL